MHSVSHLPTPLGIAWIRIARFFAPLLLSPPQTPTLTSTCWNHPHPPRSSLEATCSTKPSPCPQPEFIFLASTPPKDFSTSLRVLTTHCLDCVYIHHSSPWAYPLKSSSMAGIGFWLFIVPGRDSSPLGDKESGRDAGQGTRRQKVETEIENET